MQPIRSRQYCSKCSVPFLLRHWLSRWCFSISPPCPLRPSLSLSLFLFVTVTLARPFSLTSSSLILSRVCPHFVCCFFDEPSAFSQAALKISREHRPCVPGLCANRYPATANSQQPQNFQTFKHELFARRHLRTLKYMI